MKISAHTKIVNELLEPTPEFYKALNGIGEIDVSDLASLTKDQTFTGGNTFDQSPQVPDPVNSLDAVNKKTLDEGLELKVSTNLVKEPTGFFDPENVIISYNSTTRKMTLTGTTEAYYRGILVPELIPNWESPAHPDAVGVYFLYYNGTAFVWDTIYPDFSILHIAIANYRAVNSFGNRECHGFMPYQSHQNAHINIGTYRSGGGDISNLVLLSTVADERRPIISACKIWDEDNPTTNAELTTKKYSQRYLSNASDITYVLQANDIVPLSGSNPYYNSFNGTNYGQTLMPANSLMTVWLYEVPTTADAASQEIRHAFVQGQSITQAANSSAGALTTAYNTELAKSPLDLNLGVPAIVAAEYVAIHKFIIQFTGGNWTIRGSIKLTGTRASQVGTPSGNYLTSVSTDTTLTGDGTASTPLSVVQTDLVHKSGDETVAGVKTFSSFPVTPSSAPTTDYQVANKKFVVDTAGAAATGIFLGTSSTASATAAKEVAITGFTLVTGAIIKITFTNKNTADEPTLNIESTGAKAIYSEGGVAVSATSPAYFPAGATVEFYYDGTNWVYINKVIKSYYDSSTYIRWYNLRADGWVEQGGKVSPVNTVTLPVTMASAEFVLSGRVTAIAASSTGRIIAIKDNSTASVLNVLRNDSGFQWSFEVKGYAA